MPENATETLKEKEIIKLVEEKPKLMPNIQKEK